MLALERRLSTDLEALLVDLLDADLSSPEVAQWLRLTLDVTRGTGLGTLVHRDLPVRPCGPGSGAAVLGSCPEPAAG